MSPGRFLAGIAALIWRPEDKKYLILRRSEDKDFASGSWECPTGRVEHGESFTDAVHREVNEELGVQVQIDFIVSTTHFFRGTPTEENELLGVVYCCSIEQPEKIIISSEHSEYRWISNEEVEDLFHEDYWLSQLIRRAEKIRSSTPASLLDYYRQVNFEIK